MHDSTLHKVKTWIK